MNISLRLSLFLRSDRTRVLNVHETAYLRLAGSLFGGIAVRVWKLDKRFHAMESLSHDLTGKILEFLPRLEHLRQVGSVAKCIIRAMMDKYWREVLDGRRTLHTKPLLAIVFSEDR